MPFRKQRSIPEAAWQATMPGASGIGAGDSLPTTGGGADVPLPAAGRVLISGGRIQSRAGQDAVSASEALPAAGRVVLSGMKVVARPVERACTSSLPTAGETAPACAGNVDGSRERAALAGAIEGYAGEDALSTIDLASGVPVSSSTAFLGAAAPGIKGNMGAGVALPAGSSVLACAGITAARSTERPAAASMPAAGDAPAQSGSDLVPCLSTPAIASADYPVQSMPVPTLEPLLGDGNLVVYAGGNSGYAPHPGNRVATTSVTADCSNTRLFTPPGANKRKRSMSGLASRIAPSEELALTTAIKTWQTRKNDPIFFPYEGTEFNSFEEARDFYNLYSWEVGFGVRISRGRTNDNGYVSKKDLCCSCAGHSPNERAASSRTGCKAMIRLLRLKDHGWYISRCVATHNHPMSESCGEKQQWPSHGQIDPLTMDLIKRLRENNVSTGRVCSILRSAPGGQGMPIRREVIRMVCAKLSQDNIKDDLAKTMRVLEEMKSADGDMDVRFKLDSTGKILRMLWCTGKNKERYKQFGDAITFDTTYRTNLYNLPFGVFVGVNNHFQSTIFGGVLVTNEKTEDFEWAFSNFIEIMGGKAPQTILTDQCQAMAAAIKTTMKQTRHRWCKWHVLRKAKQWIGDAYSKKGGFKKEFHQLLIEEVSPMKFERRWRQLMRKYSLEKNKFLNRIYKQRGMWARPYFMGVFCAGMTSTQRSESANHMLKQFIQRSAPMHLFVSKFNEFQVDRIEQEDREVHLTKQVRRKHRIGVPIERHAEEIYTRAMYERFSNELYYSGSYSIRASLEGREFKVAHYKEPDGTEHRYFTVNYDMPTIISCSCGLFEHSGMLCRHCLKVLVHLEVTMIPPSNIMARWTKIATTNDSKDVGDETALHAARTADYTMKHMLVKRVLAASGVDIKVSEAAAASAIIALEKLTRLNARPSRAEDEVIGSEKGSSDVAIPQACPDRPLRKGWPNSTSLKSYQDGVKKQSRKRSRSNEASGASTTDEENPKSGKTRAIEELI